MSLTRKLAHNMIYQVVGRGGAGILAVVGIAFITRYLGREGFGVYTTITSFLMFFGVVINFGITTITVQMISERDDGIEKIMSNVFTLRFASSAIFLSLAPLTALFFPYPAVIKIGIALTTIAFFLQMLGETIIGIFQKHFQTYKPALAEFISKIVFLALVLAFIYFKFGILAMMMALNISNIVWFFICFYFARRLVPIHFAFDWALWKQILRRAWPIGVTIILNLIYLKTDVLILSLVKSQEDVGIYGAPYKLIDALTTFAMMFMGLILPLLASSWAKKNSELFKKTLEKTLSVLIIVVVPMAAGTFFVSERLMVFLAGAEFSASGQVLNILTLGAAALFIGSLFAHTIVAIDKQKKVIWGYAIDAALSFAGYLIFIPRYSYIGAAWVTVFSEVLIAIINFWLVYKYTGLAPKYLKVVAKSVLASVPMALFLYYARGLHVAILMAGAAVIYGVFIILLKGISKEEFRQIVKIKG